MSLRVVFMGSPDFSVPVLLALHENFTVVGVVTQRDKPRGRGQKISSTPVKIAADRFGIPVMEPERLNQDVVDAMVEWNPDVIVVAAYGKILPSKILEMPRMGCVNLHASLLPLYRGASPISAAILDGKSFTGVCTMLMDKGMDTGDILLCREIPIAENDTTGSLHDKLLEPGASLVVDTLRLMIAGEITPIPQDHAKATYTKLLTKKDGKLDWSRDAEFLSRLVRAMSPWPGAFFVFQEEQVKLSDAQHRTGKAEPGEIYDIVPDGILVGTGKDLLLLKTVQAPGRKAVSASDFARGKHLKRGDFMQ
ncbi:methionyl-tRNA formyltransferase [Desulfomonile tiedjei]|uniref:Methionyl-tRNA formyltransferase n=1 Tax=Desulfomonile tiedjei (strain ATCC 49306 / DSM 6799 / DCB-1) TaxID=706587 RepID=I4CB40_DESTA|nr:methionyl-tRNA formyltransferase [Desulfomonile tiedjei]AFM26781.1 methionyl-tRNA formyltransferase [Desulfomonile tiedjei DSM 6799]